MTLTFECFLMKRQSSFFTSIIFAWKTWKAFKKNVLFNILIILLMRNFRKVWELFLCKKLLNKGLFYPTVWCIFSVIFVPIVFSFLLRFRECMDKWNSAMELMFAQCRQVGPDRCMLVYYEQLVLHPKVWSDRISTFLNLPWEEAMLHHELAVGQPGGVALSEYVYY